MARKYPEENEDDGSFEILSESEFTDEENMTFLMTFEESILSGAVVDKVICHDVAAELTRNKFEPKWNGKTTSASVNEFFATHCISEDVCIGTYDLVNNADDVSTPQDVKECFEMLCTWFREHFDLTELPGNPSVEEALGNSWFPILAHSTRKAKPGKQLFINLSKVAVIYGWVVEGLLDFRLILETTKTFQESKDIKLYLKMPIYPNIKAYWTAVQDSLASITSNQDCQMLLRELQSRSIGSANVLATLVRILEESYYPKTAKEEHLDLLAYNYLRCLRSFLPELKNSEIKETVMPCFYNLWLLQEGKSNVMTAVGYCEYYSRRLMQEFKRVAAKTEDMTRNVRALKDRQKYADILERVMDSAWKDMKRKYEKRSE